MSSHTPSGLPSAPPPSLGAPPGPARPASTGPGAIALDGPVASGKTAVGRRLADALGFLLVDTGMLYRCLAWLAVRSGVPVDDGPALADLVERHELGIVPEGPGSSGFRLRVDGMDVTAQLATAAIDAVVSPVSAQPAVRAALLAPQRRIAAAHRVVMVGRDIGTVVLPDADLKVFLTASAATRARRRFRERLARGEAAIYGDILRALEARDAYDAGRAAAPLVAAGDAVVVDTDACDLAGVVSHMLALVARWPDDLTTRGGAAPCLPGAPTQGAAIDLPGAPAQGAAPRLPATTTQGATTALPGAPPHGTPPALPDAPPQGAPSAEPGTA